MIKYIVQMINKYSGEVLDSEDEEFDTYEDAEDYSLVCFARLAIHFERTDVAKVYLRFLAGQSIHDHEGLGSTLFQFADKIANGAVTAGVALAVNQILINPLPAQALH